MVRRGDRAVQAMYHLSGRVPHLVRQSQLEPGEGLCNASNIAGEADFVPAWTTYWPPLFRNLTTQGLNPCRQIRGQSLSCLQRVLLSDALSIRSGSDAKNIDTARAISLFTEVTFPLIGQLLRPETWQSDPHGMGETRLQAAVMCCKVFVKYLDTLFDTEPVASSAPASAPLSPSGVSSEPNTFPLPDRSTLQVNGSSADPRPSRDDSSAPGSTDGTTKIDGIRLWSHILQVLERMIKSGGQSDGLEEAIPESLKNIVLVMSSDGYLVPPVATGERESRSAQQKRLWKVTFVRLERFQPGLMEGIFPGASASSPVATAPTSAVTADDEKAALREEEKAEEKDMEKVPTQDSADDGVLVEKQG